MTTIPKVLFFDSGLGGLSVFREVYNLNPQCAYYYLFDHENFPYGNWSESDLKDIVEKVMNQAISLIKPDILVVACNTASTIALPTLRENISIPIVGVVPAIKPAAKLSKKKVIGLLATHGTVSRPYTDFLINEYAYDCKVIRVGTSSLVRLVEKYMLDSMDAPNELCANKSELSPQMQDQIAECLKPFTILQPSEQPDVVVLGCTHFPLIRSQIQHCLGPDIALVDSGAAIARRVQDVLLTLKAERGRNFSVNPTLTEYQTFHAPNVLQKLACSGSCNKLNVGSLYGLTSEQNKVIDTFFDSKTKNLSLKQLALVDLLSSIALQEIDKEKRMQAQRSLAQQNFIWRESGPKVMFFTGREDRLQKEQVEFVCNAYGFPLCMSLGEYAQCMEKWNN